MLRRFGSFIVLACVSACGTAQRDVAPVSTVQPVQPDLVSIAEIDPTIVVEARYYGIHNFIGRRIAGYEAPKCLLARPAALALKAAQADVRPYGLSIKAYDCYRPQRAVADFAAWARDIDDTKMKAEFYPTIDKGRLFELGYIAERSGHSRGATVDLTLIPMDSADGPGYRLRNAGQEPFREGQPLVSCTAPVEQRFRDNTLDMGTGYDCFHELSHTANPAVSETARRNRLLLKSVMEKHGFVNYAQEWWHFTFRPEPYPSTYFDVPVR